MHEHNETNDYDTRRIEHRQSRVSDAGRELAQRLDVDPHLERPRAL
jgi:hypothetical protein